MTEDRDPWYANWFGEEYLALYPHRDDEEAEFEAMFARELLAPYAARGRIGFLDLACGTGRHAVTLGGSPRGVVGLDLSDHLLRVAQRRAEKPRPGFARADMRQLPFRSGSFGAVVNFFTSFGYFEEQTDDLHVLHEVYRVLAPGGVFLSDFFNVERVLTTLASREEKTIAHERIHIRRHYDEKTRRIEKEIVMGAGSPNERRHHEKVRAYRDDELRSLHGFAGFQVISSYGDFDGTPFDVLRSPRLILLAVKPA